MTTSRDTSVLISTGWMHVVRFPERARSSLLHNIQCSDSYPMGTACLYQGGKEVRVSILPVLHTFHGVLLNKLDRIIIIIIIIIIILYFSIPSVRFSFTWWKDRQHFVRLEYVSLTRTQCLSYTACFGPFGHHQRFLKALQHFKTYLVKEAVVL
jgi:hypothetical protein